MTKEEAQQIQESIKHLGGSVDVAGLLIGGKPKPGKPKISRHLKRMTYYRERFALQMKAVIDEMIAESEKGIFNERFFKYENYNATLTENSLYLKISQSWLYIRNELDGFGMYKRFAELITIVRRRDGIHIKYQKDITDESDLRPSVMAEQITQRAEYISQLEYYLENAKLNEELNITGLHLPEKSIQQIEASICQLENFLYKISSNKIWMVKTGE